MSAKKKKKIWLVPVAASLFVFFTGTWMVCRAVGEKAASSTTKSQSQSLEEAYDTETMLSKSVVWNGRTYQYNEHLSNYLFLGIDKETLIDTEVGQADAGQSDSIFLLSWDRVSGAMTMIAIPRDTMTAYDYYARGGENLGTIKDHLSLAYAYGDGKHTSCEMTKAAVSNLFYGLPIQGYCAVSLEALPILAEHLGTVMVTVPNESLEEKFPEYQKGSEAAIDKNNVETFVRYRDTMVSQSALFRQERQEAYLEASIKQAEKQFQKDAGFVTRTYLALETYLVTNMGTDQFSKMMENIAGGCVIEHWTLPGEGIEGEYYDEYQVDEDALYEKIIETFYVEVE